MKRPLCMICLLLAAALSVWTFLCPEEPELSGTHGRSDSQRAVQDALQTVPAASKALHAVIEDAALSRKCVRVSGIVSECRQYEDRTVLKLKHIAVSGVETGAVQPGNFLKESCICYLEKTTLPRIGSPVLVEGVPGFFSSARNPGEFDYDRYYLGQGISFQLKDAVLVSSSKSRTPFRAALAGVREYACGILARYFDAQDAGVLSAMLFGDKTGLDGEVRSLYAKSGIAHMLAISGLHISLIGAMAGRLLRRMGTPYSVSVAACGIFMGSYCVMTGMSASTIRAALMFLISFNAGRVRRTYDMKTAIGVSAAVQLSVNPRLIGTAAFQLSYGAVCGIAWLTPVLLTICTDLLPSKSRGLPRLVKASAACMAVSFATLPILLVHQYEYAVYGVFFNLLVLPSVSILLPAGFLLTLSGAAADGLAVCGHFVNEAFGVFYSAGGAEAWILHMAGGAVEGLLHAAGIIAEGAAHAAAFLCRILLLCYESGSRVISALPGSLLRGRPQTVRVVIYAGMLLVMIVFTERRQKKRAGMGTAGIGWLALALFILLMPVRTGLTITMLDVGQGDGICIEQNPGHAILIDCGSSDQRNLFKNRLMPFLKYRGIYELDVVFLSHLDIDHISAVYSLLEEMRTERIRVDQIVIGQDIPHDGAYEGLLAAADLAQVPVHAMHAGEMYEQGACRLTCLGPCKGSGAEGDRNARSLILRLDYGEFQALFMGDADAQAELAAVSVMNDCMPPGTIELLKAAHHGSGNATSGEFLQAVRPRAAIISAGQNNSYGHPHEETLMRLREQGCDVYQTPECGAVMIHVDQDGMRVETFLGGR